MTCDSRLCNRRQFIGWTVLTPLRCVQTRLFPVKGNIRDLYSRRVRLIHASVVAIIVVIYPFAMSRHLESLALKGEQIKNMDSVFLFAGNMLRSASPQYPIRGSDARVIRLTADQEAVLQEQFNRWPRAPHTADVVLLAAETGLSEADVEVFIVLYSDWKTDTSVVAFSRRESGLTDHACFHFSGLVRYSISSVEERARPGRKYWSALTFNAAAGATLS